MKIFDLFDIEGVKVEDPGLRRYVNLDIKLVLKSHGRGSGLKKIKVNVIEKLINFLQGPGHRGKKHKIVTGRATGKYSKKVAVVIEAFNILAKKTGENPVGIFIKAIENAAPYDEITVIEYGGARYPQAVDCSPLRRLSIALRNIVHGAYDRNFNKPKKLSEALALEIGFTSQNSRESHAIAKKNEAEKQADSAR